MMKIPEKEEVTGVSPSATALSSASQIEPASPSRPSGLQSHDACPWCGGTDHWSGRVELCPSRAARMVAAALNTLPDLGENWQAYALRLRMQLSDEAERVA